MRRRAGATATALLTVMAFAMLTPKARADEDKAACRAAFEQSQVLREGGRLVAARQQIVQCTRVCPTGFRKPCEQWLSEVEASLPSIVPRAEDERGEDLEGVAVTIDGVRAAERLDGKSISLDPGPHTLRFDAPGRPPLAKDVVIGMGEKNRVVLVTIPSQPSRDPKGPPRAEHERGGVPVTALVAGGVAVLALGGFAYFGLRGNADHDALVSGCSKTASCSQDDKDGVTRQWLVADVFLGVGVVAVGVGVVLLLTRDHARSASPGATSRALLPQIALGRLSF